VNVLIRLKRKGVDFLDNIGKKHSGRKFKIDEDNRIRR
jgi:hypothetical protein